MSIISNIKNFIFGEKNRTAIKLMTQNGFGGFSYNGNYYKSDIVRAAIRPFAAHIGKIEPKIILKDKKGIKTDVNPYLEAVLRTPNPYMSLQVLLEKTANCLKLNNNAFISIYRNKSGKVISLYPLSAYGARKIFNSSGELFLEFSLTNGTLQTFRYEDIIHIRSDFTQSDDIFGESPAETFKDLMEVVKNSDNSIINAIKNGGIIRWIVKYNEVFKQGHLKKKSQEFAEDFLNNDSSVVVTDQNSEAKQITPTDYVPNASLQDKAKQRIYSYLGTNEAIVQSKYTEDEFQAYFESAIEPIIKQLSDEFTRKIFTFEEQLRGFKIVFSANSLQFASLKSKLNLLQMVDRGAMTPNEWREVLNLSAIEGGDKPIRRLDTAVVKKE